LKSKKEPLTGKKPAASQEEKKEKEGGAHPRKHGSGEKKAIAGQGVPGNKNHAGPKENEDSVEKRNPEPMNQHRQRENDLLSRPWETGVTQRARPITLRQSMNRVTSSKEKEETTPALGPST